MVIKNTMRLWRNEAKSILGKRKNGAPFTGVILYEGASNFDPESTIVVVATGFDRPSKNKKTGDMVQIWIMPQSEAPNESVRSGIDFSVCGDCKHRHFKNGACYVKTHQAPLQIWKSYHSGDYAKISEQKINSLFLNTVIRFGAWGDPAAVPFEVWEPLINVAAGWTGYTHQWKNLGDMRWRVFMASTDSIDEYYEAKQNGWRCFLVHNEKIPPVGRTCPAATEALTSNKMNCANCRLCDGIARGANRPDISIRVHGIRSKKFLT